MEMEIQQSQQVNEEQARQMAQKQNEFLRSIGSPEMNEKETQAFIYNLLHPQPIGNA